MLSSVLQSLMRQIFLSLLLLCVLSSCTSKPEPPLIVASTNWLGYQPLFYAKELGYFDEKDILIKKLVSGSEVIRNFRNNVVDVATLTLDESITLSQYTDDLEIILIMDVSHGADAIVAKKPINRLDQLKSKLVGVEKTALGAYMLTRALELAHLKESDIKTKLIEYNRHKDAFLNNEVDAIVTFDPTKTILQQSGGNIIFDSKDIPDEIIDVLIVRRSLSDHKRQKVQLLINSWFKTLNHINKYSIESNDNLARINSLSLQDYKKAKTQIKVPHIEKNLRLFTGSKTGLSAQIKKVKEILKIAHMDQEKPLLNKAYLQHVK